MGQRPKKSTASRVRRDRELWRVLGRRQMPKVAQVVVHAGARAAVAIAF